MAIAKFLDYMCLGPSGLTDYGSAMLRCKIWSLPFLGLRPPPSTLAQSKERKGSNFAIWKPWAVGVAAAASDGGGRGRWIAPWRTEDMERGRQGSVKHIFGNFYQYSAIRLLWHCWEWAQVSYRLIVMITAVFSGWKAHFMNYTSSHAILYVVSSYEKWSRDENINKTSHVAQNIANLWAFQTSCAMCAASCLLHPKERAFFKPSHVCSQEALENRSRFASPSHSLIWSIIWRTRLLAVPPNYTYPNTNCNV